VQDDPLPGRSTIRENIAYGYPSNLEVSQAELESVCHLANAHDFISTLPSQYDTYVGGDHGVPLSADQRQRIAIARAIFTNPRIFLLEEETSSAFLAETESDHLVQQAIDNAITGRTALIVAHRLSTMQRADQIVVMNNHQIVDIADHHTLLQRCSKYQDIVLRKSLATAKLTPESLALILNSDNNNNIINNGQVNLISASTLCTGNAHALGMEVSVQRAFAPTDHSIQEEEVAEEASAAEEETDNTSLDTTKEGRVAHF
jgi:ABC-type methionine transport system ATPase subunit